ncbi:replication initiation protein [Paraburkholderia fungorum]|uniref:replication initiation protein n=1 Tax=Paraburkholderia fungorum TaxID=134537 RepID=UPI0038BB71A2
MPCWYRWRQKSPQRRDCSHFGYARYGEAPPSCLKDFGQLRRRVIDPAVAELTGKDGLLIEWKPTKNGGRKVTGLEFTFQPNPQLFLL